MIDFSSWNDIKPSFQTESVSSATRLLQQFSANLLLPLINVVIILAGKLLVFPTLLCHFLLLTGSAQEFIWDFSISVKKFFKK
jgi:hypothetical protein